MGAKQEVKNDRKKTPFSYIKNKATLAKLKAIVPKPKTPSLQASGASGVRRPAPRRHFRLAPPECPVCPRFASLHIANLFPAFFSDSSITLHPQTGTTPPSHSYRLRFDATGSGRLFFLAFQVRRACCRDASTFFCFLESFPIVIRPMFLPLRVHRRAQRAWEMPRRRRVRLLDRPL